MHTVEVSLATNKLFIGAKVIACAYSGGLDRTRHTAGEVEIGCAGNGYDPLNRHRRDVSEISHIVESQVVDRDSAAIAWNSITLELKGDLVVPSPKCL